MDDVKPYQVELETGCLACGRGRRYVVVHDDVAMGVEFKEQSDAEEYAEALNAAYEIGRASAMQAQD